MAKPDDTKPAVDAGTKETLAILKARRGEHAKRLEENADYKALVALDQAISLIGGDRRTLNSGGGKISQPVAAKQVIREKGEPVQARDLLEEITTLGAKVGGKNRLGNLVSILSGNSVFESVTWKGKRAWWLAGKPLPAE